MRRNLVLVGIIIALLCLGLFGCSPKAAENPEPAKPAVQEPVVETLEEISGLVKEISDSSITIIADDENAHFFAIDKATVFYAERTIVINDEVDVTYSGDLNGDPLATIITMIKDETPHKNSGLVIDVSSTQLVIKSSDGDDYTFGLTDETKVTGKAKKIVKKDHVTVEFLGNYGEGVLAKSVDITKIVAKKPVMHFFTGRVVDVTTGTITIRTKSGKHFVILKDSKTKVTGKPKSNDVVTIVHTDKIIDGKTKAISIKVIKKYVPPKPAPKPKPTPKPKPDKISKVTGNVDSESSSNNNLGILNTNVPDASPDEVFIFEKPDGVKLTGPNAAGGIFEGVRVTLKYTGDIYNNPVLTEIYFQ